MRYIYVIIIGFVIFTRALPIHAGTDPARAALFLEYAKTAKKTLRAQDAMMSINLTGHKYSKEQVEAIRNFQKQYDDYLSSFNDILTLAADIYGIYYEVDQATRNIKELKSVVSSSPANVLAVAFSERKNNIYQDVITNGIQIAADVKQLLPLRKEKGKNPKMTQAERFKVIDNIRRSLRSMNHKIRKMNRLIRYTTILDSWYELRGNPRHTRTMKEIVTSCHQGWMRKARNVKN